MAMKMIAPRGAEAREVRNIVNCNDYDDDVHGNDYDDDHHVT